jgi:hypothetical protein
MCPPSNNPGHLAELVVRKQNLVVISLVRFVGSYQVIIGDLLPLLPGT